MPLLGRISFVLGATAVTLLAVGCATRHESVPAVAAAAPPSAPVTPPSAPTGPEATPVPEAPTQDVHVASGLIQVERRDLAALDAAVAWLKSNPTQLVILEGYTDTAGPRGANLELAQGRAKWVMLYLVRHGIAASRITVVARGEDGSVCADRSATCQGRNRRVHFLVRERETVQISASPSP
jgi:OOP family OmpA-OmpF porin